MCDIFLGAKVLVAKVHLDLKWVWALSLLSAELRLEVGGVGEDRVAGRLGAWLT